VSDLKAKRRDRLVQAAQGVFVAQGFRGTTMEKIAAVASVSKATLYSYFPDKPAIFDAVCERVAAQLIEIIEKQLDDALPPEDAVIEALVAKHEYVYDLVRVSDHAKELFQAKDAVSAHHFMRTDAIVYDQLVRHLVQSREDARECVELISAASQGIANAAPTVDLLRQRILKLRALMG